MQRRTLLQAMLAAALVRPGSLLARAAGGAPAGALSADELPKLKGDLTLYLGRGEGGLYEDILDAIREKNPDFRLRVRRGPSTALANTLVAEAGAGRVRADVFWSIDSSSLGMVAANTRPVPIPEDIRARQKTGFGYRNWAPVSGRIRTLPYNPDRVEAGTLPDSVMALPDTDLRFGWAPSYGAFQSFVTAMRLLEGEEATRKWLTAMRPKAKSYAGEFGVVMAVERGEVDAGFANHYYTLRLKKGQPDANVALGFTSNDAGSLLNASGALVLNDNPLAMNFVRWLLSREVQSYLAREAFEIPLVAGVDEPAGLPPITSVNPPKVDLERLADLQPTLTLLRETGVL